jgi:hypothetical protein
MVELMTGLKGIPVTLDGSWAAEGVRRWQGVVSAEEPIVGVAFVSREGRVRWGKSQPTRGCELRVELLLGHHDQSGLDVQVNFSAGAGQAISRCMVPSAESRPTFLTERLVTTGAHVHVTDPFGVPEITLSLLVLAAADVKVGRNRLWHLRTVASTGVNELFLGILTHGRTGEYAA